MPDTEITVKDLARIAVFVAAASSATHLHKGKVRELFTPWARAGAKERRFLPFSDAEMRILSDTEGLWAEILSILDATDNRMLGVPIDRERILNRDTEGLAEKSPGHMLCLIRAMHSFGMFPGYQ